MVSHLIKRSDRQRPCLNLLAEEWLHAVRGSHGKMMIDRLVHGVIFEGGLFSFYGLYGNRIDAGLSEVKK